MNDSDMPSENELDGVLNFLMKKDKSLVELPSPGEVKAISGSDDARVSFNFYSYKVSGENGFPLTN
jgi:hypothetical protein